MEHNENYLEQSDNPAEQQIAMKVSGVSIVLNIVLSLFKLIAGILAHSTAMISDAVHSASDVISTIMVIIGISVSSKKSDREHQYGHERLECVSSILLAVLLFITGAGIGITGIEKIIYKDMGNMEIPGMLALAAAVISIGLKEWMFWYTRAAAKKIQSGALMADAWHHRSDALSSVGSFIGIFGARMGFPVMDPIASVVICVFIGKAAVDIFKDAVDKMVDHSCDEETVGQMKQVILDQPGVHSLDMIKTRLFGSRVYVDIEISADEDMTLKEAHRIAEDVHHSIEREFKAVKHCMVHVNPAKIQED